MGMFDSLMVRCPNCNNEVEFQSKAGDCVLASYYTYSVPPKIAEDLDNTKELCEECGHVITVRVETIVRVE